MAYTNVTIPDRFSTREQLLKQIYDLKSENKYLSDRIDHVEKILYNIPEAIKEYGYVDISNASGTELCTLIEKPVESEVPNE